MVRLGLGLEVGCNGVGCKLYSKVKVVRPEKNDLDLYLWLYMLEMG